MADKPNQLIRHATIRQLQVFEAIARHKSFTRAAEELHLTQPTVSMQVKKLADALEVDLFELIGRKVFLTQAGETLYEAAKDILEKLESAEDRIKNQKGFSGGRVKFSVVSSAQYFVPKVIYEFVERYPEVKVAMNIGNKEQLLERIQKNEDDFYILGEPSDALNIESYQLAPNPLVYIAHKSHPLALKSKIKLTELVDVPFLMREKGSGKRKQVEKAFEKQNFNPNIKMILGGNELIRLGVLQNLGVAVASLATVINYVEQGELVILDVEGFPIHRHWYLVTSKGKMQSVAAQKLIELLKIEIQTLNQKIAQYLP